MLRPGRAVLACALALLAVGAIGTTPAFAQAGPGPTSRVVLALWQAGPRTDLDVSGEKAPPEPRDRFLRALGQRPQLSIGLISTVQGDYTQEQVLLDITQGTRQSTFIYDPQDVIPLAFQPVDKRAVIAGWQADVRRALTASTTIRPGLLASSIPGGAGYVGESGRNADGAIAAADEQGRVAAVSLGPAATLAARTQGLLASKRFVVVSLPPDPSGLAALDQLIGARTPDELLMVAQLPFSPPKREIAAAPTRFFKQTAFAIDDGGPPRGVTSATTRQQGLISAIDIAPTVLDHLGLTVPKKVRGTQIQPAPRLSAQRLERLRGRWSDVRSSRQSSSLRAVAALAAVLLLALGARRGFAAALPVALRIGALGLMWWPTMVLVSAAFEPQKRLVETVFIAVTSIVAGAVTDRMIPWPRGPLVPAAVALVAYTIDLATGYHLLTRSVLGPSVSFGARFYGISNELEPLLPILLLVGLASALTGRAASKRLAILYAGSGLVLGLIMGWGKLGADVGGVLTVAGAFSVATLMMLPGGITRRSLVVAAAMPVAAIVLLIFIDLGLSGGDHLSRNLLRVENAQEVWELVARRYILAFQTLVRGRNPAYFLAAVLAVAFAWRNRALIYGALRGDRVWAAALLGGLGAGVVGALTNDSGPVLLINAVIALAAVSAYMFGRPGRTTVEEGDEPRSAASAPAGRAPADPVLTA